MGQYRALLFVTLLISLGALMRNAAGRLAPRLGIGSLLFLLSRWPIAITSILGAAATFALILPGALEKGKDGLGDMAMLGGISLLCGGGLAALTVGPVWALIRALGPAPELELEPGEEVLEELDGNHFLGGESRGGKLLLTDRRLAFRPHRFNVQLDTWSAPRESLRQVEREGMWLLRLTVAATGGPDEEHWVLTREAEELAATLRGG